MTTRSLQDFQREIALGIARHDWRAASDAAAACRSAFPSDPTGWLYGSFVALLAEQKETALALVEQRLALTPADLQCRLQQAECLLALGRRSDALVAADAAAAAAGEDPAALDAVGVFLGATNEHGRALAVYDRALAAAPGDRALRGKRAALHSFLGSFDLAALDYDELLATNAFDADAHKSRVELARVSSERNSIIAMKAALAAGTRSAEDASMLHFALAKAYEDLGDHEASWRHVTAGNALERARHRYDAAQDRTVIERIIASFPAVEDAARDTTGEAPIFVVGLPRTGTTLVDRILGSHAQVHAAGELPALSEAISATIARHTPLETLDWSAFASTLGSLDGAAIATEYIARTRSWRGDRPRFTDKQTSNFYYCALILRAFPQARIVHVTRHPLAACYALYKTRFFRGYMFSYQLDELGDYYRGYRRLMAHWHSVLPGRILDVAYEDVVTNQETTTRRLLEYCGLPFEAACLDFHMNPASTTTASVVQVRQPLYDSSLTQWRHHAERLVPLRTRLEAGGIVVP